METCFRRLESSNILTNPVTSFDISFSRRNKHDDLVENILRLLNFPRLKSIQNIPFRKIVLSGDRGFGNNVLKSLSSLRLSFRHLNYKSCRKFLKCFSFLAHLEYFTVDGAAFQISYKVDEDMNLLVRSILGLVEDSSEDHIKITNILHDSRYSHRPLISSSFNEPNKTSFSHDWAILELAFFESLFLLIATKMKSLKELAICTDTRYLLQNNVPALCSLTRLLLGHYSPSKLKQVIWQITLSAIPEHTSWHHTHWEFHLYKTKYYDSAVPIAGRHTRIYERQTGPEHKRSDTLSFVYDMYRLAESADASELDSPASYNEKRFRSNSMGSIDFYAHNRL